jgi:hypothetical protein
MCKVSYETGFVNRNRNRKKFRNYPKQKNLFWFFRNIQKLECFGSFGCFGSTEIGERRGEGKWTGNGRQREGESEGKGKSKGREMKGKGRSKKCGGKGEGEQKGKGRGRKGKGKRDILEGE